MDKNKEEKSEDLVRNNHKEKTKENNEMVYPKHPYDRNFDEEGNIIY